MIDGRTKFVVVLEIQMLVPLHNNRSLSPFISLKDLGAIMGAYRVEPRPKRGRMPYSRSCHAKL